MNNFQIITRGVKGKDEVQGFRLERGKKRVKLKEIIKIKEIQVVNTDLNCKCIYILFERAKYHFAPPND